MNYKISVNGSIHLKKFYSETAEFIGAYLFSDDVERETISNAISYERQRQKYQFK